MKDILVTGAAGFIGSSLVDKLLERGDRVAGLDNFNDFYDPQIKRKNIAEAVKNGRYTLYEVDICDEARLVEVFEDTRPEVVVHLAARAGVRPSLRDPNLYHRVNVIGSQHVLDACRTFSPSHLVFASSSSVYGGSTEVPFREDNPVARPISPYAATKRMNELMAHVYSHIYGLNVTLLRFFTAYGPRQRPDMAFHKILAAMHRGDALDGVVKAIDTPFKYEIFNLGEHHTTSLRELINLVAKHVGKPAQVEQLPLQPGDVTITYASIDKARAQLGYDPKVAMDEGIRRFVEWYKAP